MDEVDFWRPGFRAEDHRRALAFHDSHVDALPETLEAQVADLDRLAGDALDVRLLEVDLTDDGRAVRTRLRLALTTAGGETDERVLDYRGAPEDLSTVLHVAVARALRDAAPQGPWLAWTWSDQGCGSRRCARSPSSPSTASSAGRCSSRGAGSMPRSRSRRGTGAGSGRGTPSPPGIGWVTVRLARIAHADGVSFAALQSPTTGGGEPTAGDVCAEIAEHPFGDPTFTGRTWPLADVRLLAPILPSKVVCIGKN